MKLQSSITLKLRHWNHPVTNCRGEGTSDLRRSGVQKRARQDRLLTLGPSTLTSCADSTVPDCSEIFTIPSSKNPIECRAPEVQTQAHTLAFRDEKPRTFENVKSPRGSEVKGKMFSLASRRLGVAQRASTQEGPRHLFIPSQEIPLFRGIFSLRKCVSLFGTVW